MKKRLKIFNLLLKFKHSKIAIVIALLRKYPLRKFKAFFELVDLFDKIEDEKNYSISFRAGSISIGNPYWNVECNNAMQPEQAEELAEKLNEISREGWGKEEDENFLTSLIDEAK